MNLYSRRIGRTNKANQRCASRNSGLFRVLWLIPFLAVGYIGWMNLTPTGGTITYCIDVGREDTAGAARIASVDGLSDIKQINGTVTRDVNRDPVNFELESNTLRNASAVSVEMRFQDEFPNDGRLVLGAQKSTGEYLWEESYVPFYEQLNALSRVTRSGGLQVYATGEEPRGSYEDIDDFLQNAPSGSLVATDIKGLQLNQTANLKEQIDPIVSTATNIPLAEGIASGNSLDSSTSLRGAHEFYFFTDTGDLELTIAKVDLNWYEGEDKLDVLVYSLDGTVEASLEMNDDGDVTASDRPSFPHEQTLTVDHLERGTYRLVLKSEDEDNDFVITHLKLNKENLVIPGKVHLAGSLYPGGESGPMTIWVYLLADTPIALTTSSVETSQDVTISGENYHEVVSIDYANKSSSTGTLKAGTYQITSELEDMIIEAPSAYFAFNRESLFVPASGSNSAKNGHLTINTSLRGGHVFWTYVDNGRLQLAIEKQDLNWYEGSDDLIIRVYSPSGEQMATLTIPDDGDETKGRRKGQIKSANLTITDAKIGAYRIEMKGGGDLLIRNLQINQNKLVVEGKVWVVGMNSSYFASGLSFDPVRLYGRNSKEGQLRAFSYHSSGLQRLDITGENFKQTVDVDKANTDFDIKLSPGSYSVNIPSQNILLESDGYLSFTPESFFLPVGGEVIPLKYDLAWVREHADYVVVNTNSYTAPARGDDGWMVGRASWSMKDLSLEGNKLSFAIRVPHLETEPEKVIPIDTIIIHVKTLSIRERLPVLNRMFEWVFATLDKLAIWRTDRA